MGGRSRKLRNAARRAGTPVPVQATVKAPAPRKKKTTKKK